MEEQAVEAREECTGVRAGGARWRTGRRTQEPPPKEQEGRPRGGAGGAGGAGAPPRPRLLPLGKCETCQPGTPRSPAPVNCLGKARIRGRRGLQAVTSVLSGRGGGGGAEGRGGARGARGGERAGGERARGAGEAGAGAMSWQEYVDAQLVQTGMVAAATITDHAGNPWAASAGFNVDPADAAKIAAGFTDPSGAQLDPPPLAPSCPPPRPECGDPLSPLPPRGRISRPAAAAPPAFGGRDRELLSLRLAAAEV